MAWGVVRTMGLVVFGGLVVCGSLALPGPTAAQVTPPDSSVVERSLYPAADSSHTLLVVLPGGGQSVETFLAASHLVDEAPPRGVALLAIAVDRGADFYLRESTLARVDSIVAATAASLGVDPRRIVVGGFSVGGTAAFRLAVLRAAGGGAAGAPPVAAVFGVDPPLDMERFWHAMAAARARAPGGNAAAEAIQGVLSAALGGSPDEVPEAYAARSPYHRASPRGGGAARLADVPVRLYIDPDIEWWLEQRGTDFYGINAFDASGLIALLRAGGNERAELRVETGAGRTPAGLRMPHAWNLVDEAELVEWALAAAEAASGARPAAAPGLNHLLMELTPEARAALASSPFVRDTLAVVREATVTADTGQWTGLYLFGAETYLEVFETGTSPAGPRVALALGTDDPADLDHVERRLSAAPSLPAVTRVLRTRGADATPWFDQVAAGPTSADTPVRLWVMAYRAEGIADRPPARSPAGEFSRRRYLSGLRDPRRALTAITGADLVVPDADARRLAATFDAVGWARVPGTDEPTWVGPGFRVSVTSSADAPPRVAAVHLRLGPAGVPAPGMRELGAAGRVEVRADGTAVWRP